MLRIGTAGIPQSATPRSTIAGIKRIRELGLGSMELEFVRSVQMGLAKAEEVRKQAAESDVQLTVHAPYYVNLNSKEEAKVQASRERILKAARIGAAAGARSVTFHAAFYHDDPPEVVYQRVGQHLAELRLILDKEQVTIALRPETTGSPTQFGTTAEIVALSKEIPGVFPCVDFSHLYARSIGEANEYGHFAASLELIGQELGHAALQDLHMHISGIEYGPKGERKHLPLRESQFNYTDVLRALRDFRVGGWLTCESPILEDDALVLKETMEELTSS